MIISDNDSLKIMETMPANYFKMIYIDPPFNSGGFGFTYEGYEKRNKEYGMHIGHIVESSYRLLNNDGFLCFLTI